MPGPYTVNAFTLVPASPRAAAISQLFIGTLIFLSAILVLITFLVIFALIRYRDRPVAPEAQQNFGSRKLELVWTAVPILSLLVLGSFMARTMIAGDPPSAGLPPDLRIVAHQWWWEIYYLKSCVVTANEIHIPVGKQMLVDFRSADVSTTSGCPRWDARSRSYRAIPTACGSRPIAAAPTLEAAPSSAATSMRGCAFR